jgi:signal transduction histidine kinase
MPWRAPVSIARLDCAWMNATSTSPVSAAKPSSGEIADAIEEILARIDAAGSDAERRELVARLRERVRLLRTTMEDCGDLSALSAFLQSRDERDRASLARELHDQLGGILTPAKMDLAWLRMRLGADPQYGERMARLDALIDEAIDLKRRIIEKLHPSLLDHLGLPAALRWYVEEACARAGLEPHVAVDAALGRLSPELEIGCFRLAQEAVDNAVQHARASHLDVTLERAAAGLHMTISDDGVGIPDVRVARRKSRGLAGMAHRVRSLGGTLEMRSPSGKGTRLEISIPI